MNIIYISALLPQPILDEVLLKSQGDYVVAPQKFHRNLVHGFVANGHGVKVLSYLPGCIDFQESFFEDGVEYRFCPHSDITGLKHIQIALGIFSRIRKLKKEGFVPDVLICDILNVSECLGALSAGRLMSIGTVGIVTDLMGMSEYEDKGFVSRLAAKISNSYVTAFDRYVLLTRQMNELVNPHRRPFIVMEGLCDSKRLNPCREHRLRRIFYAGGRPAKDGVDLLVSAFKRIPGDDLQLNIFGEVPDVAPGPDSEDPRVIYHGLADNREIMEEECRSCLLVNPRPTGEEYTRYSFPSKVMEYMSTGVPMVTTRLEGIPDEYFDYVFTFDNCDVDTYCSTLQSVLSLPEEELERKGRKAQDFVLGSKNNIVQTVRIIELIKQ